MNQPLKSELMRVRGLFAQLSLSIPVIQFDDARLEAIDSQSNSNEALQSIRNELFDRLGAIKSPDAHVAIGQAYTAYAEACFCMRLMSNGIQLIRTPGTGGHKTKRPDFMYQVGADSIYFEVKALDIVDPVLRHVEIGEQALEVAVAQEERIQRIGAGVHVAEMTVAAHREGSTARERIDGTIKRLRGLVKRGQLQCGATTLVVDLGRLWPLPQGDQAIQPVLVRQEHGFSACESGELWHISCGLPGERIFIRPEFDGASNLGEHQQEQGLFHEFSEILAVTFVLHSWNAPLRVLTIWNPAAIDPTRTGGRRYDEAAFGDLLCSYSNAFNSIDNDAFVRGRQQSF